MSSTYEPNLDEARRERALELAIAAASVRGDLNLSKSAKALESFLKDGSVE